jgi:DNA-directed RNA polymerase subunit RPC12/RpoP
MCGRESRDFVSADSREHACRRCGLVEAHAFASESRWEDWGGWDSTGPWRAQENAYLVCRECGHAEFVEATGRIQV